MATCRTPDDNEIEAMRKAEHEWQIVKEQFEKDLLGE